MSLIIDICPQCKIEFINDDSISSFNWFCSIECEEIARPKHNKDDTQLEIVIEL